VSTTAIKSEKPFPWPNMTAPMDSRSQPDRVPWGRWRYVLNSRAVEKGRACRREGWQRFGHQTGHPNCDLHDQHGVNQRIHSVFAYKSPGRTDSGNRLYAAASTEIWENRVDGGWNNVGHALPTGGDWCFTSLNDIVIAANGTTVLWHRADFEPFAEIPSLATIGLTGAAVCWTYEGVIFLADVVMDNTVVGNRIVWGDLESIEFEPTTSSIAGFKDLEPGERVLAAVPTGTTYTIFTTHGAWRHGVVDGEFVFQQLYHSKTRDACAVGRHAIVTNREIAYFIATDGIYAMSTYSPAPEWSEWMNQGLPTSFLADGHCVISASGYDPIRNEVLFSSEDAGLTYVINTRQTSTSLIDHAFIAMTQADMDRGQDVASWWVSAGICTAAEVDAKYPVGPRDDPRIHPAVTGTADGCAPFDAPCDDCAVSPEFVFVSADDNTLKVIDESFYAREMWNGTGWDLEGYQTRFVTGSVNWGTDVLKRVNKVTVDFTAQATDVPIEVQLVVGTSSSPIDPISTYRPAARLLRLTKRKLETPKTPGSDSPHIQPLQWIFMVDARFISLEIKTEVVTGGASCFSNLLAHAAQSPNSAT
jgi:hypothetical protein